MREEFYLDERRRKKRRRVLKLKIYGGIAAFFILMIGAAYVVVYPPLFQIKQISLINADKAQINADEVIKDLRIFFTSQSKIASILGGDNILVWRNKEINEFLKDRPQIAALTIKKDYFERRIKIEIKERERFGAWCIGTRINANSSSQIFEENLGGLDKLSNGAGQRKSAINCYWFDKEGVIFAEAPLMDGELINKVSDLTNSSLKLGDKVLQSHLFINLLKIFGVLEESNLQIKNLILQDLSLQEIIAESPSIPKIYFSLRISPEFALPAIQSLKEFGLNKVEYIDFRSENRAYYKLK